jgi:hypothetical protein
MSTILSLALATLSITLENVSMLAINVVDDGNWLEKGIDQCVPLFH